MTHIAKIVKEYEGRNLHALGDNHLVKLAGSDTGNKFSFIQQIYEPGRGSGKHVHVNDSHIFYVLEGEFHMLLGDSEVILNPGDLAYIPDGVCHSFEAQGDSLAKVLVTTFPAGLENFFQEISKKKMKRRDSAGLEKLTDKYGVLYE